jgi:hypothetical protein
MKYLKSTARWLRDQENGTAIFAVSSWTLAWCYAVNLEPGTPAIVTCPLLLGGLTIIARSQRQE